MKSGAIFQWLIKHHHFSTIAFASFVRKQNLIFDLTEKKTWEKSKVEPNKNVILCHESDLLFSVTPQYIILVYTVELKLRAMDGFHVIRIKKKVG